MNIKIKHALFVIAFSMLVAGPSVSAQTSTATDNATPNVVNDDSALTASVKSKLASDRSLSDTSIDASTSASVVTLSGTVKHVDQLTKAVELAQSVPGISDVDATKVVIENGDQSQQPITDAFITAKIKGMFIQKDLFSNSDVASMTISVETLNGVVTLSGTAENQTQIDNAIQIAKSVKGVTEVKSTVTVKANQ